MTLRRCLALALWFLMLAGVVAYFALGSLAGLGDGPLLTLITVTFGTTGLFLVWRVPGNAMGWVYLAAGALGGINAFSFIYPGVALQEGWPLAEGVAKVWDTVYFPWILTMVALPALLFPDGRLPSPRWRWLGRTVAIVFALILLSAPFFPVINQDDLAGAANPWAIEALTPVFQSPLWSSITLGLFAVALVGPAVALIARFRRSTGVERLQLKWLALSGAVAATGLGLTYALDAYHGTWWLTTVTAVGLLGVMAIPVTTGMAIIRYRLYDIDRLISRTVVYGVLVALLAGVYVAIVFVLSRFLPDDNSLSVALSTLVVATLFNPLRRRIRDFIDRRLYRSRYDAREIAENFAGRLTDEVDLDTLHDELLEVVDETVKPEAAAVWIRDPGD